LELADLVFQYLFENEPANKRKDFHLEILEDKDAKINACSTSENLPILENVFVVHPMHYKDDCPINLPKTCVVKVKFRNGETLIDTIQNLNKSGRWAQYQKNYDIIEFTIKSKLKKNMVGCS
jgi:hypothetical protein